MSESFNVVINSHLNYSNIYTKKEIVLKNIENIKNLLNSKKGLNIKSNLYWDIVELRKKQETILRSINKEISSTEQSVFNFES